MSLGLLLQEGSGSSVELVYMASALLFILGLKRLSGVKTARTGNMMAAGAMLLAIGATAFLLWGALALWILIPGVVIGAVAGWRLATQVPMTAMPELVAFFNGMGGGASVMVALAEVARVRRGASDVAEGAGTTVADLAGVPFSVAIALSVLIGAVTLSGSLVAYGKLAGKVRGSRIGPLGSNAVNIAMGVIAIALFAWASFGADGGFTTFMAYFLLTAVAALLGVGLVVAIGGADMPVVISLLNSYSGLAAAATGFALENNLLIVAGSLVGASGLILTRIMCKAMNRSLANVLFGGFGDAAAAQEDSGYSNVKSAGAEEIAPILEAASSLIVVPGYGLAVAQAQHKVRELADALQSRGCEVRYAIHPVAGRMPGHMNVLLAEADVPYEQLFDLDQINNDFKNTEVVLVIGANDVCNPAAADDTSPIAGMPVLNVWDAQTCVVVKRSLSPGYAGIKNPLFENENTLMYFADGKKALEDLVSEVAEL